MGGEVEAGGADEQGGVFGGDLFELFVVVAGGGLEFFAGVGEEVLGQGEEVLVEGRGDHGFWPNDERGFGRGGEGGLGGGEVAGEDVFIAGAGGFYVLGDGVLDEGDGVAG